MIYLVNDDEEILNSLGTDLYNSFPNLDVRCFYSPKEVEEYGFFNAAREVTIFVLDWAYDDFRLSPVEMLNGVRNAQRSLLMPIVPAIFSSGWGRDSIGIRDLPEQTKWVNSGITEITRSIKEYTDTKSFPNRKEFNL